MVERFNGRIEDVLQSHHFRSGEEPETTLHRYVWLYNQQPPQSALGSKTPLQAMKNWTNSNQNCSTNTHTTVRDVTDLLVSDIARTVRQARAPASRNASRQPLTSATVASSDRATKSTSSPRRTRNTASCLRAAVSLRRRPEIATRYDKTDTSYAANWCLTATLIASR